MLATNLPIMKQTLNSLIMENNSVMYDAAYNAFYEASKPDKNAAKIDDPSAQQQNDGFQNDMVKQIDDMVKEKAKEFANMFCKNLKDGGFMDKIADEIDKHVKSLDISITTAVPGPSGSVLACGVGPVSGSIILNTLSPTGGITIS
jgi:hypothetical protein